MQKVLMCNIEGYALRIQGEGQGRAGSWVEDWFVKADDEVSVKQFVEMERVNRALYKCKWLTQEEVDARRVITGLVWCEETKKWADYDVLEGYPKKPEVLEKTQSEAVKLGREMDIMQKKIAHAIEGELLQLMVTERERYNLREDIHTCGTGRFLRGSVVGESSQWRWELVVQFDDDNCWIAGATRRGLVGPGNVESTKKFQARSYISALDALRMLDKQL